MQLEDSFKKDHKNELSPEGVQPSSEGVKKVRFERENDKNIEQLMESTTRHQSVDQKKIKQNNAAIGKSSAE